MNALWACQLDQPAAGALKPCQNTVLPSLSPRLSSKRALSFSLRQPRNEVTRNSSPVGPARFGGRPLLTFSMKRSLSLFSLALALLLGAALTVGTPHFVQAQKKDIQVSSTERVRFCNEALARPPSGLGASGDLELDAAALPLRSKTLEALKICASGNDIGAQILVGQAMSLSFRLDSRLRALGILAP